MKTRKALLAIAVVTAVSFAFYGCDDSSSAGTGGSGGSGSDSVVSCYVELPGGDGSASCSEVPTSYPTTDKFRETCEAQNATIGSGCPAGGKKCDQGGGIFAYYYGEAAEVNSCLNE